MKNLARRFYLFLIVLFLYLPILVLMIFIVINMLFSNGDDTGVGTVEKGAKK